MLAILDLWSRAAHRHAAHFSYVRRSNFFAAPSLHAWFRQASSTRPASRSPTPPELQKQLKGQENDESADAFAQSS